MDQDQKVPSDPSEPDHWSPAREVKGTAAELRKSAASLRHQVEKEARVFSRDPAVPTPKKR